jgi:VanZ family protein
MIKKNLFSVLTALLLLYLSLSNSEKFRDFPVIRFQYLDKLVHFGMYFILMSVIIIEHRKEIRSFSNLLLISVFPLLYGILMEILQMTLTSTRSGEIMDAVFDGLGILASFLVWRLVRPVEKGKIR